MIPRSPDREPDANRETDAAHRPDHTEPRARRFAGRTRPPVEAVLALALVAALVAVAGCAKKKPTQPIVHHIYSSIVVSGPDTVLVGQTATFTAAVIDTGGIPVASPVLTWSVSPPGYATIDGMGVLRGTGEGDAVVSATGGGETSNARVVAIVLGRGWVDESGGNPSLVNLHGVHFVDARHGWAVGDLGTILVTTDAGKTWSQQISNSTGYTLRAVWFTSPTRGIVVGAAGRVLRTVDGGNNWSPLLTVNTDGGRGLNHVYLQDAANGWIVGNAGLILRSVNGGSTWQRVLPGVTSQDLERVSFPPNPGGGPYTADLHNHGWAVGAGGVILASDNFGQSWRIYIPAATVQHLYGVARRNKTEAFAVGLTNTILTTSASADSAVWALAVPPPEIISLRAASWAPDVGLAAGPAWAVGLRSDIPLPGVLRSDDGGATWSGEDLPGSAPLTGHALEDVFFLDDRHGWAVGEGGLILHTATGGK